MRFAGIGKPVPVSVQEDATLLTDLTAILTALALFRRLPCCSTI
jgi:hypothetical protein